MKKGIIAIGLFGTLLGGCSTPQNGPNVEEAMIMYGESARVTGYQQAYIEWAHALGQFEAESYEKYEEAKQAYIEEKTTENLKELSNVVFDIWSKLEMK